MSRKFLTLSLVAVAAACGLTSSAKADLALVVNGPSGLINVDSTNTTSDSGSYSAGGLSFNYSYGSTFTPNTFGGIQQISMTITNLSFTSLSSGGLTFTLTGNGNPGDSPTTSSGYTAPSAGQNAILYGTLNGGYGGAGAGITSNGTAAPPGTATSPSFSIQPPGTSTAGTLTSNPVNYTPSARFTLTSAFNLQYTAGTATASSVTTSTTVQAVPEPASIIAGLMGLPCVAGLVGVARRRLTGAVVA